MVVSGLEQVQGSLVRVQLVDQSTQLPMVRAAQAFGGDAEGQGEPGTVLDQAGRGFGGQVGGTGPRSQQRERLVVRQRPEVLARRCAPTSAARPLRVLRLVTITKQEAPPGRRGRT